MRIKTRLLLYLIPAVFVTLVGLTVFSYWNATKQSELFADTVADDIAFKQSDNIFDKLKDAEAATVTLTSILLEMRRSENPSREAFRDAVKGVAASSKHYFGVWVLWEPNAYDNNDAAFIDNAEYGNSEGRANAYWLHSNNGLYYDPSEDYDTEHYYQLPRNAGRLRLVEPYRDPHTPGNILMSSVTMPLMENGRFLGSVGIDLEMEFIQGLVADVKPYETGYAMLISNQGAILAQPKIDRSSNDRMSMASEEVMAGIRTGKAFSLKNNSLINGEKVTCLYTPVNLTSFEAPWYFMVALPEKKIMAESNKNLFMQFSISLVALLILGGLIFYTASGVSAPLRRITNYARSVAQGDYKAVVDRKGFVIELIELQTSLRSMVECLLDSMKQVEQRNDEARQEAERARQAMDAAEKARTVSEENRKAMLEVAGRVNTVAEKLQMTSEELSQKIALAGKETEQQNSLMTETVVSISAMADSITRVSANADDTAKFTERTREQAQNGAMVVNQTLGAFDSIKRETDSLAGQIHDLSLRSETIGSILGMINDIADQTNLLALNAAIEAARAGEAGRGFAVVADEVRKLAEKTVDATQQVAEAIKGIHSSMEVSAQGVARTAKTVQDTVELGHNAQNALGEIVSLVQKMNEQIHGIAGLCSEQARTSAGVNDTVERLRQLSIVVTDAMNESASITRTLEPEARELGLLVEQLSRNG